MPALKGRIRPIVLYGGPELRQRSRPIDKLTGQVRQLMADLRNTMLERDGLGLAANQIGVPLSVFAINPRGVDVDARPYCVINPRVVAVEGKVEREEGCLSIPGIYDVVARPELVRIAGIDESGRPVELEATDLLARAFMHETDHLNGVLFIDHLGPARRRLLAGQLKGILERRTTSCD